MSFEQAGDVGLTDAYGFGGGGLSQAALGHHVLDPCYQLRLEQVAVGIGIAQVGEDVAAAQFDCFGDHAVPFGV